MNETAIIIAGGWGSPDLEWKLSPFFKKSVPSPGIDFFIFRKCSIGWGNIEHIAKELVKYVRKIKNKGYRNIFLVGHSMGGLVCRMAELYLFHDITGIITLATPHHGTLQARLGKFTKSGRQMTPGSNFLRILNYHPAQSPVLSIVCNFDECVWPIESQIYRGGDVKFYNLTHLGPLFSKKVATDVLEWINERTSSKASGTGSVNSANR